MGALLDDAAMIENKNAVEPLHGGQAMGDDECCASFSEPIECVAYQGLGHGIEARRGFVKNQNRRAGQDRSGDGNPLTLAAGELDAALADQGFVT